ncbi:MAG: hypothetical protein EOR51_22565 [Mesorhizobium sp.]|nr:MAG: hypothetical protein EOR51_22565 [Mesorhizobium sp.]
MLTKDEIEFLRTQGLTAADVYDGRIQTSAGWKAGVRASGKTVVLGSPCTSKGHRLRTRSGHCAQCDTAKLGYQRRHNTAGYIYIAGSRSAKLIKVGTCVDIDQRVRNLKNQAYGNTSDWVMLFTAHVDAGGKTESDVLASSVDEIQSRPDVLQRRKTAGSGRDAEDIVFSGTGGDARIPEGCQCL